MNTTSLHIKVENTVKQQAQQTASELGLSLSAVVKALLKQFIRTRQLSVELDEEPTPYLLESLKKSEEDIRAGKVISFKTGKDALKYVDSLIENDRRNKQTD